MISSQFKNNNKKLLLQKLLINNKLVRNRLRVSNLLLLNTVDIFNKNYVIFSLNGISANILDKLRSNLKKYDLKVIKLKKSIINKNSINSALNSILLGEFIIIELCLEQQVLNYIISVLENILIICLLPNIEFFFLIANKNEKNLTLLSKVHIKNLLSSYSDIKLTIIPNLVLTLNSINFLFFSKIILLLKILKYHKIK